MRTRALIALAAVVSFASLAEAHVTLEQREAQVGAPYRAVFRVPHGCGNSPTTKVRVRVPEGVAGVKPMPKAGWQLDMVRGKYEKPYTVFHSTLTEGVKELSWTGRLPDELHEEFIFNAYLTDDLPVRQTLYFPVVQECENGVHRWIEVPAEGKSAADYKEPAPGVRLLPKR